MQKASFARRFIYPVGTILIILVITKVVYDNAWHIPNDSVHKSLAFIAGAAHIGTLWFASFLIYPWMYFKGASLPERVIACLIPPVAWTVGEIVRVTEFFTIGESLYYGLNSQFLVSCAITVFFMGLLEIICRAIRRNDPERAPRTLSSGPILAMVAGVSGIYVFLIWGVGAHWFYIYQQGYKALFH